MTNGFGSWSRRVTSISLSALTKNRLLTREQKSQQQKAKWGLKNIVKQELLHRWIGDDVRLNTTRQHLNFRSSIKNDKLLGPTDQDYKS